MTRLSVAAFGLVLLSTIEYGQDQKKSNSPFTLTWTEGKCVGCRIAAGLGEIQFVSRSEVWGVGFRDELNAVNTIVVHSTDAGRTWREVPQTRQLSDPDGRLAFSFLDVARGWIAWWDPADDQPKIIHTTDGGQHWQDVSKQTLQRIQMVDDRRGYGTVADKFFRTDDGGHSWIQTKIPDIRFIDRMVFLTPDNGWVAGVGGKDFFVSRTANGGRDWKQSRTTPPQRPERVRDLFFFDRQRGWLTIWNHNDEGAYLYSTVDGGEHWTPEPDQSFQGKGKQGNMVRFISRERGFVFFLEGEGQSRLMYTTDGGIHWHKQALPRFVYDCQVFEGDLLCSSAPGFRQLTVHPR